MPPAGGFGQAAESRAKEFEDAYARQDWKLARGYGDMLQMEQPNSAAAKRITPKLEEVTYARKLIDADEKAKAEGRGSFSVDGKMIDIPVIDRARRLIARYDAIERRLKKA